MMSTRFKPNLKTAQLMFEPVPPSENRLPHHECPMMRRRVQSAKPRITSQAEKREEKLSYHEVKFTESVRPKSAITNHERVKLRTDPVKGKEINRNTQVNFKPLDTTTQKEFLPPDGVDIQPAAFGLQNVNTPCREKLKPDINNHTKHYPYKLDPRVRQDYQERKIDSTKKMVALMRQVPAGVASLAEWISEDVHEDVCGMTTEDCLIFIPCLRLQREMLTMVPPPQDGLDPQKCKLIPAPPKPYDPKDLFHYDVAKHIPRAPVCSHAKQGQIYGIDGKLMHDARNYGNSRNSNIIQKEIQDLEKLLKGIGSEDGCAVVQYQNEINMLQMSIKRTFEMCDELREAHGMKESPEQDMFGFQRFSDEHELFISRIRARREVCVEELSRLEASLGMTCQNELVQTYQHL